MKYRFFSLLLLPNVIFCAARKSPTEREQLALMLSTVQSDVADRDFAIDVQREILRGAQVHHALIDNDQDRLHAFVPRQNAVRALVWWLYAVGQKSFSEGTFVVPDTLDYSILTYMQQCPGVYRRISTHFKSEGESTQWGFDIGDLPTKTTKRTILFGKAGKDLDDNNLIFIKPETWGTATWPHFIMHASSACVALARKFPALRPLVGSDDDEGYQKERIPYAVWCGFVDLIEQLEKEDTLSSAIDEQEVKKTARTKGIAYMVQLLQGFTVENTALQGRVDAFIAQLYEAYDHVDKRIGNEVVISFKTPIVSQDVAHKLFQELIRRRVLEACA